MNAPLSGRARRGWYLYDWANSAFATVILAAIMPFYFTEIVVPKGGVRALGLHWDATILWGYASSFSALLIFILAPHLGAIADASGQRRKWMLGFFLPGSLCTVLLFTIGPGDIAPALVLYICAAAAYVAANIFYDSFLPHLGPPDERDRISACGYAWGYLGGGLLFFLNLLLIYKHEILGLKYDWAVRIALASAGIWWGGFGLIAWRRLEEPPATLPVAVEGGLVREAWTRVLESTREILRHRNLALFFLAFLFYNDGVQTVVKMAAVYGADELGFSMMTLLGTLLMVQIIGIFGALLFGKLADTVGSRRALMSSLVLWLGIVIWGYYIRGPWEFWALGGAVGLCLGGTQAISRSYFTRFIPVGRSAEYYGFYSVFAKFSAIGGPLIFGLIKQVTGSSRLSILALGIFFLLGLALLSALRETRSPRKA